MKKFNIHNTKDLILLKIAKWYKNFQAPSVLMLDDLSDAYINVYNESYKNDWGYLCDTVGSSIDFLKKKLLTKYPNIKITFFVPYEQHNIINENSQYAYKKYALGEREEYTVFLKELVSQGHEIAHHGSNHGKYIDKKNTSIVQNWIHEWALFDNIEEGVNTTLKGVEKFKTTCNIDIVGGKYCGYITNEISETIIDNCNFLYWCEKSNIYTRNHKEDYFGENRIISFPTNFSGNSFNRLTYMTGNPNKDRKKKMLKFLQPIYNLISYFKLYQLYKRQNIISIQEHISPSTTAGIVQSANIITDTLSLQKIFDFLNRRSIWYATCKEISQYISTRDNSTIEVQNEKVIVYFRNKKSLENTTISITGKVPYSLIDSKDQVFSSQKNNNLYVVNVTIVNGINVFHYRIEKVNND